MGGGGDREAEGVKKGQRDQAESKDEKQNKIQVGTICSNIRDK